MPKRAARSADTEESSKKFRSAIDAVADEWVCPISCELPVDPVMAEDGRTYERSAIEEVIRVQGASLRSPITNVPMGPKLIPSVQARNSIERLVKSGAIHGDKAAQWEERIANQAELDELRRKAEEGHVDSMNTLAGIYKPRFLSLLNDKYGLKQDSAMSFHWYKKAADADDPHGLAMTAYNFINGSGVKGNITQGLLMMARAAARNSPHARKALASWAEEGEYGLNADPAQARLWRDGVPTATSRSAKGKATSS